MGVWGVSDGIARKRGRRLRREGRGSVRATGHEPARPAGRGVPQGRTAVTRRRVGVPGTSRRGPAPEDVARTAGVFRATVSRVVNRARNADPDIRDLVRRAVEQTGYRPNRAARSLVTRRTETVALLIPGAGDTLASRVFADPFCGRVVSGAVGYLRAHAMHPVILVAESEVGREQAVDYPGQGAADGARMVSSPSRQSATPMSPTPTSATLTEAGRPPNTRSCAHRASGCPRALPSSAPTTRVSLRRAAPP